jgi:hypothetical protein
MPSQKIDITPTVNVLHSLKRTGYHWSQAMLDIIDNSVDTLRERHRLTGRSDGMIRVIPHAFSGKNQNTKKAHYIVVADNGMGMDASQLQEILRLGESGKRGTEALGTFGMGLKTAAMALGSNLSIVSTTSTVNELNAVTWDVESCMKKGKFEANFISSPTKALINTYLDSVGNVPGTMVIIGNLHEGFPTIPAMTQTLNTKCAHVYRHMLNSDSPLGYHFPFDIIVGKTIASKKVIKTDDPLCISHELTSVLIGDPDGSFETVQYGNCELQIRLTRFSTHGKKDFGRGESRKVRSNLGLGKQIVGTHKQGVYWLREGREISGGAFWSSHPLLSNVYAEISFKDSGMANDSSPIRMDFGKKGVDMDDDLRDHLINYIFEPYLEKIRKVANDKAKAKRKADRTEIMKSVASTPLPTEHFGRSKAPKKDRKTQALEDLFTAPKKNNNSKRKNSKYRGTGLGVGGNQIHIDWEECTWPMSSLPFCINYSVGDPVCTIQINVEDPWIEKNIYLCEDKELIARSLQVIAGVALSGMHESEEKRMELYTKFGAALNSFEEDFGRVQTELEEIEMVSVLGANSEQTATEEMVN